ncbi:hypothetical protein ACFFJY_02790 [Fictibacillus aquaticus]|uniref:Uncharacterized protein n=1 Tax=Fictibacillus aquaticus TaxID=2021314 RepID=A0A235F9J5_9BACL|nr:hypothetical protein [Fictibacillus aquaticus]OYD57627.1 hypothetical protein CGZ90_13255 [Fictibacillus aquaticus]
MKETFDLDVVEASGKGSEELVKKTSELANDIKSRIQNADTKAVLVGRLVMFDTRGKVNTHSRIKVINPKKLNDYVQSIRQPIIRKRIRGLAKEKSLKQSEVKKITKQYIKLRSQASKDVNEIKLVEEITENVHQETLLADMLYKYDKHLKQLFDTLKTMQCYEEIFTTENLRHISKNNRLLARELEKWIND